MDSENSFINKTKQAVNFLTHVYNSSASDVGRIVLAQAEGDADTLRKYLITVRDFVNKMISKLE